MKLDAVDIELTNRCNFKCKMCYSARPRGDMGKVLFTKIVEQLDPETNVSLHYAGESLLHPYFREYAKMASRQFKSLGLSTNGSLLNPANRKTILDCFSSITISLEGFAETTNSIRVGADYEAIRRNIFSLIEERGVKETPKVLINITEGNQTPEELFDFAEYWTRKVDLVRSSLMVDKDLKLEAQGLDCSLRKLRLCHQPFRYLAVLWNGNVVPCCADWNGINIMGNAYYQKIYSIWNNLRFTKLRLSFLSRRLWPLCKECGVTMMFETGTYRIGDLEVKLIDRHREYTMV